MQIKRLRPLLALVILATQSCFFSCKTSDKTLAKAPTKDAVYFSHAYKTDFSKRTYGWPSQKTGPNISGYPYIERAPRPKRDTSKGGYHNSGEYYDQDRGGMNKEDIEFCCNSIGCLLQFLDILCTAADPPVE